MNELQMMEHLYRLLNLDRRTTTRGEIIHRVEQIIGELREARSLLRMYRGIAADYDRVMKDWTRWGSSESEHEHKWIVYSTAVGTGQLLLECECGERATVDDPSGPEWKQAFHAPSYPYPWTGGYDRVAITTQRRVL